MPLPIFVPTAWYPLSESVKFDTDIVNKRGGAEDRRSRRARPLRSWSFASRLLTADLVTYFNNFFIAREGQYGSFNYVSPLTGETHECRFGADERPLDEFEPGRYSGSVNMAEVSPLEYAYDFGEGDPTTFDPVIRFPYNERPLFSTRVSDQPGGVENRAKRWSASRRVFELTFQGLSTAEAAYIQGFFIDKMGAMASFTYVSPETLSPSTVRFERDELALSCDRFNSWSGNARLLEVAA